jgi:hypothetical protein
MGDSPAIGKGLPLVAGDDDITLGELGRLIKGLSQQITDIPRNFLALQVWAVEKAALDEQRRGMGREIGELRAQIEKMKTEKQAEHKAFDLELDTIRAEANSRGEQARKARAQVWLAIGLAALSALFGVGSSILSNIANGGA